MRGACVAWLDSYTEHKKKSIRNDYITMMETAYGSTS
jgi:hypothetical protein